MKGAARRGHGIVASVAFVRHHRTDLQRVARRVMLDRGLAPDFSPAALAQVAGLEGTAATMSGDVRDLRALPWCSIADSDSRDIDQLSVSQDLGNRQTKILVAIADVDALVAPATPLDAHAASNTMSVCTDAQIFPMLPERLSTELTSLSLGAERASVVVEYAVAVDGRLGPADVYRAVVRNQANLTFDATTAWLDGKAALPEAAARVEGMELQLRTQEEVAARLRRARFARGALEFASLQSRPVFDGETVVAIQSARPNRAKEIIEEFMIAASGVMTDFLDAHRRPSIRRVVRSPERWERLIGLAAGHGESLPSQPSGAALQGFLAKRRATDPLAFPDLSLAVVKLVGRGEYVAETPGETPIGHFGLAARDYSHSTAPNRRFSDLITQRLLKATLAGQPSPYSTGELAAMAQHCTVQETSATKVERQVSKSGAAILLQERVGECFDGMVTGASKKGTYARIFDPAVEGRIVDGFRGLKVGDKVRMTLMATNFERGHLDFACSCA